MPPTLALALALLPSVASTSLEVNGAPRSAWASYHVNGDVFACADGSKHIPIARLNDDYCDCADGSDEPGTGACEVQPFFCANIGYKGQYLPASRVSDGICDCCDGSDERTPTGAACSNTCAETGAVARAAAIARAAELRGALQIARGYAEQASAARKEWEKEVKEVDSEKAAKETEKTKLETARDEMEAVERTVREARRRQKEAKEAAQKKAQEREDQRKAEAEATAASERKKQVKQMLAAAERLPVAEAKMEETPTITVERPCAQCPQTVKTRRGLHIDKHTHPHAHARTRTHTEKRERERASETEREYARVSYPPIFLRSTCGCPCLTVRGGARCSCCGLATRPAPLSHSPTLRTVTTPRPGLR